MNIPRIIDCRFEDGIKTIQVQPSGVCTMHIEIELEGDIIRRVMFIGGCSGNTQGIASLVHGMKVCDVIQRLEGISCGGKGTSCQDQLAQALKMIVGR